MNRSRVTSIRRSGALIGGAVGLTLATLAGVGYFQGGALEDAYITFRYARHLAEGYGYGAWNTDGSLVDGSTSFLWTWWLSSAFRFGIPVLVWATATSVCSVLMLASVTVAMADDEWTAETLLDRSTAFAVTGAVGLYVPVLWYAGTGMEAVTFMAFGGLAFLLANADARPWRYVHSACCVVLVLLRPEGILIVAGAAFAAVMAARFTRQAISLQIVPLLLALAAFIALAAFRYVTFGDWLPNTFYAKAGSLSFWRVRLGLQYVWYFALAHQVWIGIMVAAAVVAGPRLATTTRGRWLLGLVSALGIYGVYIVYTGGDEFSAFPFWRHFLHVYAITALALGVMISLLSTASFGRLILMACALVIANAALLTAGPPVNGGGASLLSNPRRTDLSQTLAPWFAWVDRVVDSDMIVATSLAGSFPYSVDAVFIDTLGLNDHHIAHFGTIDPVGPIDSKTDMNYVVGRRPDVIEGYLPASAVLTRNQAAVFRGRAKMVRELVQNPTFLAEYCFATTAPYDILDRALFLRTQIARARGFDESDCVPVRETILADVR